LLAGLFAGLSDGFCATEVSGDPANSRSIATVVVIDERR
jgi:hypothetical protein